MPAVSLEHLTFESNKSNQYKKITMTSQNMKFQAFNKNFSLEI